MKNKVHTIKQILTAAFLAFALDAIVLGWLANSFYDKQLHFLLRPTFEIQHLFAVVGVYLLIALGQIYFVKPTERKWKSALGVGALFGFITYGIYEFTNYAIIITWKFHLVLFDLFWGTLLNAIIALVLWKLYSKK